MGYNSVAQKKSDGKQGFGFVDNRPEAVTQRKLQHMANNSSTISKSVAQLKTLQRAKFTTHESFVPAAPDPVAAHHPYTLGFQQAGGAVTGDSNDEKMQLLHHLSEQIQNSNSAFQPHVALSFHAGIVRVAVNRGTSGSAVKDEELSEATKTIMNRAGLHVATLSQQTQKWFAKYINGGNPNIRPLSHNTARIGMTLPEPGTIHAEQFISKDVVNEEQAGGPLPANQYRGQNGVKHATAGSRKVVRIGGMLDDCALCHMDHHGEALKAGIPTNHNPRFARTEDYRMIFTGEGVSSDALLRPYGKGIMTTGTHWRAAHGVAIQSQQPALHIGGQGITLPTQEVAPAAAAPVPAPAALVSLPRKKRRKRRRIRY